MPAYPPQLTQAILDETTHLLRTDHDRESQLLPSLQDWEKWDMIDWSGPPRAFMSRLINQLPPPRLQHTLRRLLVGHTAQQHLDDLCHQIAASQQLTSQAHSDPLTQHHQRLAHTLSGPRHQLDKRFVALTLLLDQGVV